MSYPSLYGGIPASWVLTKAVDFNFTRHKAGSATKQRTTQQCSPASHSTIGLLHEPKKQSHSTENGLILVNPQIKDSRTRWMPKRIVQIFDL